MSDETTYMPEWAPEHAGSEFASHVMVGLSNEPTATKKAPAKTSPIPAKFKRMKAKDYVEGVLTGNRMILARAITLVESNAPQHFELAQEIIQQILPYTGNARRIGITGVPGAGKSTFIEALGCYLCNQGSKVAVLAVDPSSSVTHGSILGDKTRMENLTRQKTAFIRPSPSGGTLGGVTRKSRETLLLCEAAGYDTILVETVGVGQGETTVRSMVDFFLVVVLTGAGDDLQGIKKGIIELADAILVNKADGDNKQRAMATRAEYEQILHYLRPATEGWQTKAYTCSSVTGEGIADIWEVILHFENLMKSSHRLEARRQQQTMVWVKQMAEEYLHNMVEQNPKIMQCFYSIQEQVMNDQISATRAAQALINTIETELQTKKSRPF